MKKIFTIIAALVLTISVQAQTCDASFLSWQDPSGLMTFMDSSYSYPGQVVNYIWELGDGTSATGNYVEHTYNASGAYLVCLTIETSDGCTSTFCDTVIYESSDTINNNCMATFYMMDSSGYYYFYEYSEGVVEWDWSFSNGIPSTSYDPEPLVYWETPGSYDVCLTILTADGCTSTICETIQVSVCDLMAIGTVTNVSATGLADGAIDIAVSGGTPSYSYYWDIGETTEDLINISSGIYTVNIYDAMQCSQTLTFTVGENVNPCDLSINMQSTQPTSYNNCDGTIYAYVDGNANGVNYLWDNGDVTPSITDLCSGTYCVTITTADGCEVSECYSIYYNDTAYVGCYMYFDYAVTEVSAYGVADGAIDITVYGGTAPYMYSWDNGITYEDLSYITDGIYTVEVFDANGCSEMMTFALGVASNQEPVDTLWTAPIDTCIVIIDYYISDVNVLDSSYVDVTWALEAANGTSYITVTYGYDQTGYIVVTLTINCAGSSKSMTAVSEMIEVSYGMISGINNTDVNGINIYPNPVNNQLFVDHKGSGSITIFDITGKTVYRNNVSGNSVINTSNLNSGLYFIKLTSNKGEVQAFKFIKR